MKFILTFLNLSQHLLLKVTSICQSHRRHDDSEIIQDSYKQLNEWNYSTHRCRIQREMSKDICRCNYQNHLAMSMSKEAITKMESILAKDLRSAEEMRYLTIAIYKAFRSFLHESSVENVQMTLPYSGDRPRQNAVILTKEIYFDSVEDDINATELDGHRDFKSPQKQPRYCGRLLDFNARQLLPESETDRKSKQKGTRKNLVLKDYFLEVKPSFLFHI